MNATHVGRLHAFTASLPGLRRLAAGPDTARLSRRYTSPLRRFLHQLFAEANLENADDGFRFTIRNPWLPQNLLNVEIVLDGRRVDGSRVALGGNKTAAGHLNFAAPITVTVAGKRLGNGRHFLALTLVGTTATLPLPQVPVFMEGDRGHIALDPDSTQEDVAAIVPFAYNDALCLLTSEKHRDWQIGHLLEVIRSLEADPRGVYALPDIAAVRLLAVHQPAAFATLKQMIETQRVEMVMGFMAEPGFSGLGGESVVRQVTRWQTLATELLGRHAPVAWLPTAPAAPATLPQVLRKAGCESLAIGCAAPHGTPARFSWEGLDGTRLRCARLTPVNASFPLPLAPVPTDPDQGQPLGAAASVSGSLPKISGATSPGRFFVGLPEKTLPVVRGSFVAEDLGAARPALRRMLRQAETAVTDLERLPVILDESLDASTQQFLADAWDQLLDAQRYGVVSGAVTTEVAADLTHRLRNIVEHCAMVQNEMLTRRARAVSAPDSATGAVIALNTLPFWRDQIVTVALLAEDGVLPDLFDGKYRLAKQVLHTETYADGELKRGTVAFRLAVPPLGYRVVWTQPQLTLPDAPARAVARAETHCLENGWLTVEFDPSTGAVATITDRHRKRVYKLNDAGLLSLLGTGVTPSQHFQVQSATVVEGGPLRCVLRFAGSLGDREAEILYTLSQTSKALSAEARITGAVGPGRLAVRVPRLKGAGHIVAEIPYGQSECDGGRTPAGNYLDIDPPGHGLTILNRDGAAFEVTDKHVLLHLASHLDRIHWLRDTPVPLPERAEFSYGFFPHENPTGPALVFRRGLDFTTPLLVAHTLVDAAVATEKIPRAAAALTLSPDNIQVGAVYREADGAIVLRLVERGGKDCYAQLKMHRPHGKIEATDLLGRPVKAYEPGRWFKKKGVIDLRFRAFEIKTLRFHPA
ncbi:MAG: hypothetical protein P9L99_02970 [Candidatus Lernaella stagnicola]|nr:hypothetical protein [Candidatus Lernaella stagnicola]